MHPFSYVLTPTWGAEAMRRAVDGRSAATALLISAALSLVYVALAVQLMRMVERRARVTGSLALA